MSDYKRKARKDDLHITIYQLVILVNNYLLSLKNPAIGHLDADFNIRDTLARFKKEHVNISKEELERFLFAANMMDEEKKFWHPGNDSFDKFTYEVARKFKFNKDYNMLVPRNEPTKKE